jgi:hypothetical protein
MLPREVHIQKLKRNKQKQKQYMTTKPPVQKILKRILRTEDENKHSHESKEIIKPQENNRQAIR